MSKRPFVPPTFGSPPAKGVQVPAVDLANVTVTVGTHPVDPTKKAMIIGPVMLVLPFDPEAARVVASALAGIDIVPASAIPLSENQRLH